MALSKRLRYEILRRDDHTCRYCGGKAPDAKLTVDHVIPVSLGGLDDPSNLVAACKECNGGKSSAAADSSIVAEVDAKALLWRRALLDACDFEANELNWFMGLADGVGMVWDRYRVGSEVVPRPTDWTESVLRFLRLGVTHQTMCHFVRLTMERPRLEPNERWRFFCGCCWRHLDNARDGAAAFLAKADSEERESV